MFRYQKVIVIQETGFKGILI